MVTCRTPFDHVAASDPPGAASAPGKDDTSTSAATMSRAPAQKHQNLDSSRRFILASLDGCHDSGPAELDYKGVLIVPAPVPVWRRATEQCRNTPGPFRLERAAGSA